MILKWIFKSSLLNKDLKQCVSDRFLKEDSGVLSNLCNWKTCQTKSDEWILDFTG